jgi:hypothetical protein
MADSNRTMLFKDFLAVMLFDNFQAILLEATLGASTPVSCSP